MRVGSSVVSAASVLLCLAALGYAQEEAPIGVPVPPLGDGPWVIDTAEQHKTRVSVVARGLENPWAIAFLPDGAMLVTERSGRLRIVRRGALDPQPISGVPQVRTDGNGGLMDVAVHPDFADNGLVYLTYTKRHDGGRGAPALARGRLAGHALHDLEDLVTTEPFHSNAGLNGRVAFGRDGKVYMSTGGRILSPDGELLDTPQDPGSLRGKVLRLNDDGSAPDDNPFVNEPGPSAGDLHDRASQHARPHAASGDRRHLAARERSQRRRRAERPPAGPQLRLAADELRSSLSRRARVRASDARGLRVAARRLATRHRGRRHGRIHGRSVRGVEGNLFVGSLQQGGIPGTGHLQRIVFNENMEELRRETMLTELRQRIREVREGPDGLLYLLTDHDDDGALLRIEPAP